MNPQDECQVCGKQIAVAGDNTLRVHGPRNARCKGSRRLGVRMVAWLDEHYPPKVAER